MKMTPFQKTINFIRSIVYIFFSITSLMILSLVCVFMKMFSWRHSYDVAKTWTSLSIWLLRVICGVNYRIIGLENIPKDRNGIILCKHQSAWETYLMPGLLQPTIILKKELLWLPFFGWALWALKPIAIDRNDKKNAMNTILREGKAFLDEGRWILIFPEGTRIPPGKVGNYRLGGARLAVETGYPVLPIAHNAGYFWPKKGLIKKPGIITVVIGPLIETKGRSAEEVLAEAKEWIEGTVIRINQGEFDNSPIPVSKFIPKY